MMKKKENIFKQLEQKELEELEELEKRDFDKLSLGVKNKIDGNLSFIRLFSNIFTLYLPQLIDTLMGLLGSESKENKKN